MAADTTVRPPNVGLLTRTLVESPVIKKIIPARIRHRSKNDIIFVYERSVRIKELCKSGVEGENSYLEDIAIKNNFDSTIRAARIFGLPRTREHVEPEKTGIDAIVKQEMTESPEPEPQLNPELPPHILALTLESLKLVFLCAFHQGQEVHFFSSYRHLPWAKSHSEQLGEHLAVDPQSRAMAVGAVEGSFYFFQLRPMDELKRAVTSDDGLDDARLIPIIGVSVHK